RNGVQQIYRVPLGGGEAQRLTNDSGGALWPRWSPDGQEIAFQTFHGGRRQACVASAEGEGVVQVSVTSHDERAPTWAPDGQRLLTLGTWPTQPRWHVFTRNASRAWSAGEQVLLVIGSDTVPPSVGDWSPDGRMLACGCGDQGLVTVPSAGGPARRLVPGSAVTNVAYPAWATDGRLIYYITREAGVPVTVSVVAATGGAPRVVVRFDDPTRPWHRYGLRVHGGRVYFILGAERFLREIRVTGQLQHPHILTLIDSGEADGFLYYVMPYVEGESLRQRLEREGQLPLDEALRITGAIATALDFAHGRGVIHRDIKPENIMLHQGEPMVAAFGIALAVSMAGPEG